MAVTPEEGGLPAGVMEKYDPQNLILTGEMWPKYKYNIFLGIAPLIYSHLSVLVEAATVAPPPGTVIQSRVQVSPNHHYNKMILCHHYNKMTLCHHYDKMTLSYL